MFDYNDFSMRSQEGPKPNTSPPDGWRVPQLGERRQGRFRRRNPPCTTWSLDPDFVLVLDVTDRVLKFIQDVPFYTTLVRI